MNISFVSHYRGSLAGWFTRVVFVIVVHVLMETDVCGLGLTVFLGLRHCAKFAMKSRR